MKITEKKYSLQADYYWDDEDKDRYFDTVEDAIEYFDKKMPNHDTMVVVQKVAVLRDVTEKARDIQVEPQ